MGTLYERRILNDPEVRLAFGDPLIPIIRADEVTLELDNTDGYFDSLDLRGERISYDRFDRFSSEQLAELTGIVINQELKIDRVVLRTVMQDLDDLQTLLPRRTVDAATFPLADSQQGLGKTIPIVFGLAASTNKATDAWELPYVTENTSLNQYDYLLGEGLLTNATLYRNTIGDTLFTIPSGDYTITSSAYAGFTVARFALRQTNFSGGMHRIFGAADGLSAERNFAIAIQSLLGNSTWGLGLSVNSTSFATAATALTTIGNLFCDGVMIEQRSALDWLNQMLVVRGMSPSKNNSGQWTISVDAEADVSIVQARFGHGSGQQWGNVREFESIRKTPVNEATKSLVLDYRKDQFTNRYLLSTTSRTPLSFGRDLRMQNDLIRDRTTADKVADFISKTLQLGDERLSFTVGQEARKLRPGDLVGYESTRPVYNKTMRIVSLSRTMDTIKLETRGWSRSIYTYTAGALPTEPVSFALTDISRMTPTAVTSLSIAGSGTEVDGQGGVVAFQTLQYNVASESWAQTLSRRRRNGTTNWETVAVDQTMGNNLQTKITGLITGLSYDYEVSRVNILDSSLFADVILLNRVAPGDTTAPPAPTAITVRQGTGKSVEIVLTFSEPADWGTTQLYRNTSNDSSTATLIETKKAKAFHDVNVVFNTTYYYWAKVLDWTGNASGFSPSSGHTITPVQIGTGEIGNNAVTASGIAYTDDVAYVIPSSETILQTMTISTNGGSVVVFAKVNISVYATTLGAGLPGVYFKLRKDSVTGPVLDTVTIGFSDDTTDASDAGAIMIGFDSTPSTSQTYHITAWRSSANTNGSITGFRVIAFNLKK